MIRLHKDGAYWKVILDRPDKANSLTRAMLEDLTAVVRAAEGAAGVLVLTGTGSVFSAGADLDHVRDGLAVDPIWEELSGRLAALPCLTVAALNGTLAGGAFGIALACDVRIAVPDATFFYPVMKLGFLPQPSDPARLNALIGPARTKLILMCGQRISSTEALDWGLIDRITPPETLDEEIHDLCADALAANPRHVAAIKGMIL